MNLRLTRNSVYFRLSQADAAILGDGGVVTGSTSFGPDVEFSYCLRPRADIPAMHITLGPRGLCVDIPAALVNDFNRGQSIGLHDIQPIGDGKNLEIYIEKDFECDEARMLGHRHILPPTTAESRFSDHWSAQ